MEARMSLPRPHDYELLPCALHGTKQAAWVLHMRRTVGNTDKMVCCVCAVESFLRAAAMPQTHEPQPVLVHAHDAGLMRR